MRTCSAFGALNFEDHFFLDFSRRHSLKYLPDPTRHRIIASFSPNLDYLVPRLFELLQYMKRHSYELNEPTHLP